MKSRIKIFLWIALVCAGFSFQAKAQKSSGSLEVTTQLKEATGTYDQRKLYRKFMEESMKDCPYVHNFSIRESIGTADNHKVEWHYRVDGWDDITKFYSWLNTKLKSGQENGVRMALTPYAPNYSLGGKISVAKRVKSSLAKH